MSSLVLYRISSNKAYAMSKLWRVRRWGVAKQQWNIIETAEEHNPQSNSVMAYGQLRSIGSDEREFLHLLTWNLPSFPTRTNSLPQKCPNPLLRSTIGAAYHPATTHVTNICVAQILLPHAIDMYRCVDILLMTFYLGQFVVTCKFGLIANKMHSGC